MVALPRGKSPSGPIYWTGDWLDPRERLDIMDSRNISALARPASRQLTILNEPQG
jgi:hypothetical protein